MTNSGDSITKWRIENGGTYASVVVELLSDNCRIHCESDAIITMTANLELKGQMRGGLWAALCRRFLTDETFFATAVQRRKVKKKKNQQIADGLEPANLMLAATEPGDIMLHQLTRNDDLLLTRGSYVAADESVNISTNLQQGLGKGKLSGTGLFLIRAYGTGTIACSAFGAIHRYDLKDSLDKRMVDNGHLIGWSANMKYSIAKATSSLLDTWTSGEGIMLHFSGPGTIYIQSHVPRIQHMAAAAAPKKRKSAFIGVGLVVLLIVVINVYFFFLKHKPFDRFRDSLRGEDGTFEL